MTLTKIYITQKGFMAKARLVNRKQEATGGSVRATKVKDYPVQSNKAGRPGKADQRYLVWLFF